MEKYQSTENEKVIIEFDRDEALVLFDLIARWQWDDNSTDILTINHKAETHVLLNIATWLNEELDEPSMPDYEARIQQARKTVIDTWRL